MVLMNTVQLPLNLVNPDYLFLFTEPYRSCPFQIVYGGASSGKSVAIAQRDIVDMVNEDRNFLITRNVADSMRASVFEERKKVISYWGLSKYFKIHETNMDIMYRPRGNVMYFSGLNDVERIKSITPPRGVFTDVRVEEATETKENDIIELRRRMRGITSLPKRTVFSFNPTFRTHWIAKTHFNGQNIRFHYTPDKKLILRTTYRSNNYLTQQDRDELESLTGYQRQVYCEGEWGVLGDLILNNWEIADIADINFDVTRYGLDFGFSADPSALIKVGYNAAKKEIYIQKDMYIFGGVNDVLASKIKPHVRENIVYCDCAEPRTIAEIRNQGEQSISAYPCKKGKDSVWHSLQWLQQHKIIVDRSCQRFINEVSQFQWKKNKQGETLPEPVDGNDHCIAALRYALEQDMVGSGFKFLF